MLSHFLGRLSNFNCYVAYINPSMGLNASCFFGAKKPLASHITWHVTRLYHSVTRFGTGIASGGPALQTLGQQKSNIDSMLSACCA